MEKVPQIVSQRLRAASTAIGHPDADILTAFSEHSLRKPEQAAVIEHLARCVECREIIALALPATESVQQSVRPASSTWLTWPALRWGFVTAGIVALASFGVMQYQHRSSMTATRLTPTEVVAKEARNLPPAQPLAAPAEDRDKTTAAAVPSSRKDLASSNPTSTPSAGLATPAAGGMAQTHGRVIGGTLPHGPRVQWQQNNLQQQTAQAPARQLPAVPLPSAPPSASTETADIESAAGALSADSSAVQNKIDQQALQHGLSETKVERSKPAASTVATAPMASFHGPARPQLTRQSPQATAPGGISILWTITAGRLQRSLDQGATWQDIDVNNHSSAGASLALMKTPSMAKELSADNITKKDASAPLVFRAVASNGPDVWAGASAGLLYHSTDAGGSWTRIAPSTSGVSLTGDIVSLEFVDPQHGRVVTSTPEVWTTSDAGQSWQKQ